MRKEDSGNEFVFAREDLLSPVSQIENISTVPHFSNCIGSISSTSRQHLLKFTLKLLVDI